jgi:ligand-binding SRPBCC domain-containing protein
MKYTHHFRVGAPLSAVETFHRNSDSMAAITPPPILVRLHSAPEILNDGDEITFTLWLGPLPVFWQARIKTLPDGFLDRQIRGPFRRWEHQHIFISVDDQVTEVHDEIQAELQPHLIWGSIGLVMWLGMPVLFAFRSRKTCRLLIAGRRKL